jgi:ABC-type oligopeptide transport system substrate-binding subunit
VTPYSNNWIVRQKISNYDPIGFQGFAMNMRRPSFDDVRVRKALCHLVNRERMNATLMYNQYFLHRSFMEDLYDAGHPFRFRFLEREASSGKFLSISYPSSMPPLITRHYRIR